MIKLNPITRKFLVDVAEASKAEMTIEMAEFIAELATLPVYDPATEDEIETFDKLLDAMEG